MRTFSFFSKCKTAKNINGQSVSQSKIGIFGISVFQVEMIVSQQRSIVAGSIGSCANCNFLAPLCGAAAAVVVCLLFNSIRALKIPTAVASLSIDT